MDALGCWATEILPRPCGLLTLTLKVAVAGRVVPMPLYVLVVFPDHEWDQLVPSTTV